jgi:hypothetical protein
MVAGLHGRTREVVRRIHHGDDDDERQDQRGRRECHEARGNPESMLVHL